MSTINPGLTLALILLFLALVIAIVILACMLIRVRSQMFTARREASRSGGKHRAAVKRAEEAEEQCARLFCAAETAVAAARQAVDNKDQLELVNQQLGQLFAYVSEPLGEHVLAGEYSR